MRVIDYVSFLKVPAGALLAIVNEDAVRTHLVSHPRFDPASLQEWLNDKLAVDALPGCRIRAVYIEGILAGWCGIQPDAHGFELAIVLSRSFHGHGIPIFRTMLTWASEFGHREIVFHLLDSRPEYRALQKISSRVHQSEWSGRVFTTYHVPVSRAPVT